jgi:hypothetical protein
MSGCEGPAASWKNRRCGHHYRRDRGGEAVRSTRGNGGVTDVKFIGKEQARVFLNIAKKRVPFRLFSLARRCKGPPLLFSHSYHSDRA